MIHLYASIKNPHNFPFLIFIHSQIYQFSFYSCSKSIYCMFQQLFPNTDDTFCHYLELAYQFILHSFINFQFSFPNPISYNSLSPYITISCHSSKFHLSSLVLDTLLLFFLTNHTLDQNSCTFCSVLLYVLHRDITYFFVCNTYK